MGTMFLKSIDASHITKIADKIFKMVDEVVEEVGEENVVQVVTDNATNYKAVGKLLMEKRERLYWTPCAAHCIDLMLEDLERKISVYQETIPKAKKITTYIYSRTLLITLLQSFTKGKDLIRPAMTRFATSYLTLGCLHEYKLPLIRMFNSDEWKGSPLARKRVESKSPTAWRESYGDEVSELQKFDICVLSLTSSSSECERNWSAFKMVHTKKRNRQKQKTMNDVVFVMTNSRLTEKKHRKPVEYNFDDLESDDDWIVKNEEDLEDVERYDVEFLQRYNFRTFWAAISQDEKGALEDLK
ncbi:hypothetical protein K1719_028042 [Acacia pycnantha]|nr:hypothetical protein K1719_028042 [Acacia pycnantha]